MYYLENGTSILRPEKRNSARSQVPFLVRGPPQPFVHLDDVDEFYVRIGKNIPEMDNACAPEAEQGRVEGADRGSRIRLDAQAAGCRLAHQRFLRRA